MTLFPCSTIRRAGTIKGSRPWCIRFLTLVAAVAGPLVPALVAAPVYQVVKSIGNPDLMGDLPLNAPVEDSAGVLYGNTFGGSTSGGGVIYRMAKNGSGYQVIHHGFSGAAGGTGSMHGRLVLGSDGRLYGTGLQSIFGIDRTGTGFVQLKFLPDTGTDPQELRDGLLQGSDGRLYGVSRAGGTLDAGTIFRLSRDGTGFQVLKHFTGTGSNAEPVQPRGALIEATDGRLYGTSVRGGVNDRGTVFRINKDGTGWQVLRQFSNNATSAVAPAGGVVEGPDGVLYGVAQNGPQGDGAVYKINKDGTGYLVVYSWSYLGGSIYRPNEHLSLGSDGYLYGTCEAGGAGSAGGTFRINRAGTEYTVLHEGGGYTPQGLHHSADGWIYGTERSSFSSGLFRLGRTAGSYQSLRAFSITGDEPGLPEHVLEGADKLLYVSTDETGDGPSPSLFRMKREGTGYALLRNYREGDSTQREPPQGLIQGSDGQFYGTTYFGGSSNDGTVFRLSTNGTSYTALHNFNSFDNPGNPSWRLVEASNGLLYGVARGSLPAGPDEGIIFRIAKNGTGFTVLRQFSGGSGDLSDGSSELIQSADGKLYGVCSTGGPGNTGGIYSIGLDGTGYRVLRYFSSASGGLYNIYNALCEGSDGRLFGVAQYGGTGDRGGLFRINRDGTGYTVLTSFTVAQGRPATAPVEGTDGRIYGTTSGNVSSSYGTLYAINKDGTGFTIVHNFGATSGDALLPGHLMRSGDGFLYGTAKEGGSFGYGAVFRYGEAPEVSLRTAAGAEMNSGSSTLSGGTVRAELESSLLTFTVHNTGQLPLGPFSAVFEGLHPGDFSVASLPAGTLPPGGSATVEIRFAPQLPGSRTALLRFLSNDYDEGTFFVGLSGVSISPEIAVHDGAGDTDPALTDGQAPAVDFGVTRQPQPVSRPFTVRNTGTAPLRLDSLSVPSGFSLLNPPALPLILGINESLTLSIMLDANARGTFAGSVVIASDDLDEAEFDFPVTGTVITPEIAVYDGADATAPSLTDAQAAPVDLGTIRQGAPRLHRLTIINEGTAPLRITQINGFEAVVINDGLVLPLLLDAGASLAVELKATAAAPGIFTGMVGILSDDLDEEEFSFPATVTVITPEITVRDGVAAAPELSDGQAVPVDFGRNIQGTPRARTFTISNDGTAELLVSGITIPAGYSLLNAPAVPLTLGTGQSASFHVSLTTITVGTHSGSVVIASDDLDEAEFDFPITGEVFIPDPVAAVVSTTTALNRQTGLREQTIHIANDTTATVPAYNLIIRGLPEGVEVNNASSRREDGSWVVYVRQTMNPQSAQDILLEYFSANRGPVEIAPQLSTEVVLNPPDLAATGGRFIIDRVLRLEGGAMLLEFPTTPGRQYQVQYSHDGTNWQASLPNIRAAANRTQWTDRGLPRTDSHPSAHASRFYRVAEIGLN